MKIVFLGKTKKKTRVTQYMFKALQRQVSEVTFINLPRTKRLHFWTDYKKVVYQKIRRADPDLVLIFSTDIPYPVLEKIRNDCITAIFFPDHDGPRSERLIRYGRVTDYVFLNNKSQHDELKSLGVRNPVFSMRPAIVMIIARFPPGVQSGPRTSHLSASRLKKTASNCCGPWINVLI